MSDLSHSDYQQRLKYIQESYDERVRSLSAHISHFLGEARQDEVYQVMRENSLSKEFAEDHVKELLQETLSNEKELTISKLQEEIASLKLSSSIEKQLSEKADEISTKNKLIQEMQEHVEKTQAKVNMLKKKILSQKNRINALEKDNNLLYEKHEHFNDRFKKVLSEIETDFELKEQTFKEQHQLEIENLKAYYQEVLEDKIQEIQEIAQQFKHKEDPGRLKSHYEQNIRDIELKHINEVSSLKSQIEKSQTLLESATKDNKELRTITDSFKKAYDESRSSAEEKVKNYENERKEAICQLELAMTTMEELKTKNDELSKDVDRLSGILSEQEHLNNSLEETLRNTQYKFTQELNSKVDEEVYIHEKEKSRQLELNVEENRQVLYKLNTERKDLFTVIEDLEMKCEGKDKEIQNLSLEISRLNTEADNMRGNIRNKHFDIDEYKEDLRILNSRIALERQNKLSVIKDLKSKLKSEIKLMRSWLFQLKEYFQNELFELKNSVWKISQEMALKLLFKKPDAEDDRWLENPSHYPKSPKESSIYRTSRNVSPDSHMNKAIKINHLKHKIKELKLQLSHAKDNEALLKHAKRRQS